MALLLVDYLKTLGWGWVGRHYDGYFSLDLVESLHLAYTCG